MSPKRKKIETTSLSQIIALGKRRRYLTIAVLSWVTVGLLTVTVVVPQVQKIMESFSQLSIKQKEFDTIKNQVAFVQRLDRGKLSSDKQNLEKALPAYKPLFPLLSSLEYSAIKSQVALANYEINPGSVATMGGKIVTIGQSQSTFPNIYALPLKLEVSGAFENISNFFKELDMVLPLLNVNTIEFSVDVGGTPTIQDSTSSARYRAIVQLDSLYIIPSTGSKLTFTPLSLEDETVLTTIHELAKQSEMNTISTPSLATGSGRSNVFTLEQ